MLNYFYNLLSNRIGWVTTPTQSYSIKFCINLTGKKSVHMYILVTAALCSGKKLIFLPKVHLPTCEWMLNYCNNLFSNKTWLQKGITNCRWIFSGVHDWVMKMSTYWYTGIATNGTGRIFLKLILLINLEPLTIREEDRANILLWSIIRDKKYIKSIYN
jgi:hypothetical protein